jgi:prepilin-type N-terminal cleavage/methylation domain-containing protein
MHRSSGVTLIELAVVLAVIAAMAALSAPVGSRWAENQRLAGSIRDIEAAFNYARSEAIRTGNIHLVFLMEDADGNDLDPPVLVVDDGRPGASQQNCEFDTGEPTKSFDLETGVSFGVSHATAKVGTDPGAGSLGASTFEDAGGNAASWVLFRPEGYPLAFSSDCSVGAVGSGGGGIYLTNGARDVAVTLTPLGSARVHSWESGSGSWTQ